MIKNKILQKKMFLIIMLNLYKKRLNYKLDINLNYKKIQMI